MTIYGKDSGIAITAARVRDFRSLAYIEVSLNDLTVLIGANNAGKASFLDGLFAAIGAAASPSARTTCDWPLANRQPPRRARSSSIS